MINRLFPVMLVFALTACANFTNEDNKTGNDKFRSLDKGKLVWPEVDKGIFVWSEKVEGIDEGIFVDGAKADQSVDEGILIPKQAR